MSRAVSGQTQLLYLAFETPTRFITPRETLTITNWHVDPAERSVWLVAKSVEDPEVPITKAKIRANVFFGGWYLRPIGDGMTTQATYMTCVDLGGSLPGYVVKKATSVQGMLVATVRQYMQRVLKGPPKFIPVMNLPNGPVDIPPMDRPPQPKAKKLSNNTAVSGSGATNVAAARASSKSTPAASKASSKKTVAAASPGPAAPSVPSSGKASVSSTPAALPSAPVSGVWDHKNPLDIPKKLATKPTVTLTQWMSVLLLPLAYVLATNFQPIADVGPWLFVAAVGVFVARFLLRAKLGPAVMSTRKKLSIASWSAPHEGNILGALTMDMVNAQQYLAELKERTGTKVTITHLVIKALAEGFARCPSLNGHLVMGDYIPASTVDIGCLVLLERNEGTGSGHNVRTPCV